jgi:prevent-host-death family protein
MRTVNIGDLKARLSAHIRRVRRGEEVLVCDRNKPVARIIPWDAPDRISHEKELIANGVLEPPRRTPRSAEADCAKPPGNIPDDVVRDLWRQERGED